MRTRKNTIARVLFVMSLAIAGLAIEIATPSQPASAVANLIGHWTFDDGTATDVSGNGNDGIVNGALPVAGHVGAGSLDFDGVDDYVDIGNLDVPGSAVTVAAWVNSDNLANCSSRDCRIISKASSTSSSDHYLMLSTIRTSGGIKARFRLQTDGSTTTLIGPTVTVVDGVWTHIAATYDGALMTLYVDGVVAGSTSKTGTITANPAVPLWIGGNPPSPTVRPWDGKIDDVRLYDGALTAVEIEELAGQTPAPDTSPPLRSNGAPTGVLAAGTTEATLSLNTDEAATCRYGTVPGTDYASLPSIFTTTGLTAHSAQVTGLTDGSSYDFYVRCEDTVAPPNINNDDFPISFSIDLPVLDVDPPLIERTAPTGVLPPSTTETTLALFTNEVATCRYDTVSGTDFSLMPNTFSTTGTTAHSTLLTGLSSGGVFEFFVRCQDDASPPNSNPDDIVVSVPVSSAVDSPVPVTTLIGSHPQAILQSTDRGKQISTLFGWDNKLYMGYGDWQENTGPIDIVHYDPATSQFINEFTFNTESVQNFRSIDGKLYVPSIDPTGSNQPDIAVRDAAGVWTTLSPAGLVHSFDVNTLTGTDLWLAGAGNPDGEVYRSIDGGTTWSLDQSFAPASAFARAYFAGVLDNKLYVEPWSSVITSTRVFDGVSWSDGPDLLAPGETGWRTEEFSGAMFLRTDQHPELVPDLRRFDGLNSVVVIQGIRDFVVDGTRLYVLQHDGTIHYTDDGITYSTFSDTANLTFRSIGVLNGSVYVGTSLGEIFRFGPPPPDTSPPVLSNGLPAGALPAGTTQTTISVDTDEPATCRYGTVPGTDFALLPDVLATADGIAHSDLVSGLTDGSSYDFYVRCEDTEVPPNVNTSDFQISFSVSSATAGLVAQWTFDDGTAVDLSGNGNDGVVNGALPAAGRDGTGALDFDGTNDYVDAGGIDVAGSEVTLSAWINADNLGNCRSSDCRIVSKASGTSTQDHYLMLSPINSNGVKLRFRLKSGGSTSTLIATAGDLVNGKWTHVAGTYDGVTMRVFVDGVEVGALAKTGTIDTDPTVPFWIGGNPPSPTVRPFDGKIDEVSLYNRALSPAEIEQLANIPTNDAPVGVPDGYAVDEDAVLVEPAPGVLANDTDAESDPLTAQLVSGPANGLLTLNADGSFTYTPSPDFNGQDSFTYEAVDATQASAPTAVTITVNPVNDAPTANGDAVTVVRDTPTPITLTGDDIDGDALTFTITTQPSFGTLSPPGPEVTYTPDPGYVGPDSFSFTAFDGLVASLPADVQIDVIAPNDPPVGVPDEYQFDEDTVLDVSAALGVLQNDTDTEGDPLTATLFTLPSNGLLTLNSDGSFTYTPDANFNGQDFFSYLANDPLQSSDPTLVTITVNAVNDTPVADSQFVVTGPDVPVPITLTGSDIDGDLLQYQVVDGPLNGTLSEAAPDLTYTPHPLFTGADSFTFTVFDGIATSSLATVDIQVTSTNTAPRIVTGTPAFTKQVVATDVDETHAVVPADFNGDGAVDLASTDFVDNTVFWHENNGAGGFISRVVDSVLGGAYPLHTDDVDGDGDADLLAGGYSADTYAWYENDGSGNFTRHDIDTFANGAHSIVTVDLDGDGDLDLVTAEQDGNRISWYENDGSQNFTQITVDAAAPSAKRTEPADVNGDGFIDLITATNADDTIAWYENDGSQNFTKHIVSTSADGAYYVESADLDGDGDLDLFSASQIDGKVAWYRNDGVAGFTEISIDLLVAGARTVVPVDINQDGNTDILAAAADGDFVAWYENDGTGAFTRHEVVESSTGAYSALTADMDMDGDPEVLSASRDLNEIAIHFQHQAHFAYVLIAGTTLIDTSMLQAVDVDDVPAGLTYTLSVAPLHGDVALDGIPVLVGGTFTQLDIDSGRLSYVHSGLSTLTDSFSFSLADGGENGVLPADGTFELVPTEDGLEPTLLTGLVGHWEFDDGSGTDSSGNGNDGVVNGAVLAPGHVGAGALDFDGIDDYVDAGGVDVGGTSMSITVWINSDNLLNCGSNADCRIASKSTGTSRNHHYFMLSTTVNASTVKPRFRLKIDGSTQTVVGSNDVITAGAWHHVAATYDGTEIKLYLDGNLVRSLAITGTISTDPTVPFWIGGTPPAPTTKPWDGKIDDLRLYDRALSLEEIQTLAGI